MPFSQPSWPFSLSVAIRTLHRFFQALKIKPKKPPWPQDDLEATVQPVAILSTSCLTGPSAAIQLLPPLFYSNGSDWCRYGPPVTKSKALVLFDPYPFPPALSCPFLTFLILQVSVPASFPPLSFLGALSQVECSSEPGLSLCLLLVSISPLNSYKSVFPTESYRLCLTDLCMQCPEQWLSHNKHLINTCWWRNK